MINKLSENKILIVEDSSESRLLIKVALGESKHHVYVENLEAARKELSKGSFDVILLDLVLPDGNGYELCSELNTSGEIEQVPVIIISSKNETTDKVLGLSLGVQDFVTKPFSPLELQARVVSRIKTFSHVTNVGRINCGNLLFEETKHKATVKSEDSEEVIELSQLETQLLKLFLQNKEHILSRQMILDSVWGSANYVLDRSVDSAISGLRKKLKSWDFSIQAVYGAGYRVTKIRVA